MPIEAKTISIPDMIVHAPGSTVVIGEDIRATVRQVCISDRNRVTYEVSWWQGRDHKTTWLEHYEVSYDRERTPQLSIGFHN